jgi:hypothetical protein
MLAPLPHNIGAIVLALSATVNGKQGGKMVAKGRLKIPHNPPLGPTHEAGLLLFSLLR